MALAGNKMIIAEKEPEKRKVDADEAQAYADENGLFFSGTSARNEQTSTTSSMPR